MAYKILAVNPGSTSTKVAVYLDREQQWVESISHTQEELKPYPNIYSQLDFRADLVRNVSKHTEIRQKILTPQSEEAV